MIDYPPCKICGVSHEMGMEDITTGEISPLDICRDCLFAPQDRYPETANFDEEAMIQALEDIKRIFL